MLEVREEVGQEIVTARVTWNSNCVRVMGPPEMMRDYFEET